MADTATLESGVSQAQSNGAAAASTKPPVEAVNPGDASAGEVADDELSEVPKTRFDAGEEGDEVDLGEEDEYDFEVSARFTSNAVGSFALWAVISER